MFVTFIAEGYDRLVLDGMYLVKSRSVCKLSPRFVRFLAAALQLKKKSDETIVGILKAVFKKQCA